MALVGSEALGTTLPGYFDHGGEDSYGRAKAMSFKEKVFEKNKTANEKVAPNSTVERTELRTSGGRNSYRPHCISRWTGEMPVERHPGAFSGNVPPLLPEEA